MAVNPDMLEVITLQTLDGKVMSNVEYYVQSADDTNPYALAGDAASIAADLSAAWTLLMAPNLTVSHSLTGYIFREVTNLILWPTIPPAPVGTEQHWKLNVLNEIIFPLAVPVPGLVAGDFLPTFASARAQKLTTLPGRRWKGHWSQSGLPESSTLGDLLTAPAFGAWQAGFTGYLVAPITYVVGGVTFNLNPVVYSKTAQLAAGAGGALCSLYTSNVLSQITNQKVGTMRRRKLRTGPR